MTSSEPRFTAVGEEVLHRSWVISLNRATFLDPEGRPFEREIVRHPGAVAVLAVTDAGTVVLVEQYRPAVDRWLLEVPAGTRDVSGEPEEVTARRELAEEAGYAAGELTLLVRIAMTPGFCDQFTSLYLATGLTPVAPERQGVEERYLRVVEVGLDDVDALVDGGRVVDATTVLGLGLVRRRLGLAPNVPPGGAATDPAGTGDPAPGPR